MAQILRISPTDVTGQMTSRIVIMIKGVPAAVLFTLIAVFGAMFARPSEAADQRTPVVFIPGVLGSVLDDPKDIVFGILPDSLDRFAELQLPWDRSENPLVRGLGWPGEHRTLCGWLIQGYR